MTQTSKEIAKEVLVIYHAHCADGAGAAYAAWQRFGEEAEYRPAQYGEPAPTDDEVRGRDVFILDFSYPRRELLRIVEVSRTLRVIDHHKTAAEDLAGLPFAVFDMTKSGAVLAWEDLHDTALHGTAVPEILLYIQDRDLWQWKLPGSKAVSAALQSRGVLKDFRQLLALKDQKEGTIYSLVEAGTSILNYQDELVEALTSRAAEVNIAGHKVLCANAPVLQSEVAGKLAVGRPFGACWFATAEGKIVVSLRVHEDGDGMPAVDVSAIAKNFGGGGHAKAAGFTMLGVDAVRLMGRPAPIRVDGFDAARAKIVGGP